MNILKNTYLVKIKEKQLKLNHLTNSQTICFQVIKINGTEQKTETFIDLPNPCAYEMINTFQKTKIIMGETLAQTVVQYLNTDKKKPIIILFPNTDIMTPTDKQPYDQLNQNSKNDLDSQIKLRQNLIEKHNLIQK